MDILSHLLLPWLVLAPSALSQDEDGAADAALSAQVDVVNLLIANETADDFFARGVAARDSEQIAPALIAFLTAFRIDPQRSDAAFEIARLFTVWDEQDLGWIWLGRAVDAGYWSEYEMQRDDALSALRNRAGFDGLVERVRENYDSALPGLRGMIEVRRPKGDAPAGGWPILLCLHGYGTDQRDLITVAELGASQGFVGISIVGYLPISPGRHAWPDEGPAIETYIRNVLQPFGDDPQCNTDVVYATGFSQGGLVATYLVAAHPDRYHGAIPISPAGPLTVPSPLGGSDARPLYMLYGMREGTSVHENVHRFSGNVEQAGGRVKVETHTGGHEFPDNWSAVLTRGLTFLREESR